MAAHHQIEKISIEDGVLCLTADGVSIQTPLASLSRRFVGANKQELGHYEVSPSGYGIHWPLLDEDVSIDGLLGITHQPEQQKKSA